jgi:hypothetical protein
MADKQQPPLPPPVSFMCSLVAGGLAGVAVDVSMFPLDTVKTRLQSAQGFQRAGTPASRARPRPARAAASPRSYSSCTTHRCATHRGEPPPPPLPNCPLRARQGVSGACAAASGGTVSLRPSLAGPPALCPPHAGGFRGIYSGLGSAALGSFPTSALFFATYEATKHTLADGDEAHPAANMLAGSCGEVVACLFRVPTENVKQKL